MYFGPPSLHAIYDLMEPIVRWRGQKRRTKINQVAIFGNDTPSFDCLNDKEYTAFLLNGLSSEQLSDEELW